MMRFGFLIAALLIFGLAACGDDDNDDDNGDVAPSPPAGRTSPAETPAAGDGAEAQVDVELVDFSVIASPTSAAAGSVTFNLENTGPDHAHEFMVIKTDLMAADLPTAEDGSVDEEAEGLEVIDEVEEFEVDGSETLTVDLEPGHYALICNVVHEEGGEMFIHYERGMHTDFTVQ